ncbi:hypothetical protein N474_01905 [Pseudoalteromonas luteoviolacea CPMOR-2]|uniref:MBL fold metallo-hydrolase n=1 Tax=Pseudoalteromonas luteoviolacea TaxID=43657 RepID=UPI0007B09DCD|nr:MBL fold metallo-hydrolase [Pseudoalteromonas luteoviolacea]KZN54498.1 hypothetical protein N474_01905 [Pseudoalteromonas luteoviolacea CPMOR-2]
MCIHSKAFISKVSRTIPYLVGGVLAMHCQYLKASEGVEKIIERAVAAYGAEALLSVEQMIIEEQLFRYSQGQSGFAAEGLHAIQLHEYDQQLKINFEAKSKTFKRGDKSLIGNYGHYNMTVIDRRVDKNLGVKIDHCLQSFQQSSSVNWDSIALGMEKGVDTLVVKALATNKANTTNQTEMYINGRVHDVFTQVTKGVAQTFFFDRNTGLLSRVINKKGGRSTRYDFMQHTRNQDGVAWAKQTLVTKDARPSLHVLSRDISTTKDKSSFVLKPKDYKPNTPDAFLEFAEPSVNQIAVGVYLVGQGWGFTLFFDIGDSYVSMGAWQMPNDTFTWKNRVAQLQQFTGNKKRVSHFIVTHHHDDHLMGLNEVVDHGAQLLLLPEHLGAVQESFEQQLSPNEYTLVQEGTRIELGHLQLIDIPSSHADHNLVVYLPTQKVLFAEDMFGSSFEHGFHSPNSWPSRDVYYRSHTLNKKMLHLGLDIEQYVSSHHGRVLSKAEFNQSLQLFCPDNKELKRRLFAQ